MVKNFHFPKKLRLLTSQNFKYVFQNAKHVSTPQVTILARKNALGHPRLGFTIAKKHIKHAHERNRIKRLIRESFRLHQYELPSMDFVIIAKPDILNLNNKNLIKLLEKLWSYYCQLTFVF